MLQKGDALREGNHADERPVAADARFGQFQVAIPGQCHEEVVQDEQDDGVKSVHKNQV